MIRIGHGYDVHRLTEGRALIIGGIKIPYKSGLDGHSDADVLTHAVIDAILGAAGLGDIGQHFPDTDPAYKNADSIDLARKIFAEIYDLGYCIGNIDSTVIAQHPRLAPYTDDMRSRLAYAFDTVPSAVNVKATTEEGLGFTGSCEAIAAHAVVLLTKRGG
ncbi:MAG: 2-C-methyl-D-erythritol 2,4-cyclodiphosphate synthase [Eubacteriales bacterium]